MRYNLVNGGLCSEPWAHVWSSVLPWGTAWMLYQGSVTRKLLDYSGLVLNGFTDFVAPGVGVRVHPESPPKWLTSRQHEARVV